MRQSRRHVLAVASSHRCSPPRAQRSLPTIIRTSRSSWSWRRRPAGRPTCRRGIAAQILSAKLGQPFVVENRPGAGGALGARVVATAPPDGYTLLVGNTSTLAVIPAVSASAGYDPVKDFIPIVRITEGFQILVVHPDSRWKTRQGVRRRQQGQPRQDQLRPHRRRRSAASGRRDFHAAQRRQAHRRVLPQRRRVGHRRAEQGGRRDLREYRDRSPAHRRRQVSRARRAEQDPDAAPAGIVDHGGGRRCRLRRQHVLRVGGAGRHARRASSRSSAMP